MNRISVIIPTTCETGRWGSLKRAIASAAAQERVSVELIIVVNGLRFDPECYEELRSMPGLNVVYLEEGSLPLALKHGRSLATAPYFAFLDDDDEYLPGALWRRLQPLLSDEAIDYVVSNGYSCKEGRDEQAVTNVEAVRNDPLRALLHENWLASCGGLYRSSRISAGYFDGKTRYLEWTLLAYKLASSRKMVFVDEPTYRIHDSLGSLSKSEAFREAEIGVLAQILTLDLPAAIKAGLRVKIGRAYHGLSNHYRRKGDFRRAWRCHLASLRHPEGFRYLVYSRRLLPFVRWGQDE